MNWFWRKLSRADRPRFEVSIEGEFTINWFRRKRVATDQDRRRAEALVQVELFGMMGGRTPDQKLTPVMRGPRLRPAVDAEDAWLPIDAVLIPPDRSDHD
jgi:hypothetical protein